MHSSGMRTTRLLTVSQHALGRGCIPACTGQRGVCIPACTGQGGVSARGGCLPRGCMPGGCTPPSSVDRILDTRLRIHYLSANSFADGNKKRKVMVRRNSSYGDGECDIHKYVNIVVRWTCLATMFPGLTKCPDLAQKIFSIFPVFL